MDLFETLYGKLSAPGDEVFIDKSTPEGLTSRIFYPDGSSLIDVIFNGKTGRKTFTIDPSTYRRGQKGEGSAYVPAYKKRITLRDSQIENLEELLRNVPKEYRENKIKKQEEDKRDV